LYQTPVKDADGKPKVKEDLLCADSNGKNRKTLKDSTEACGKKRYTWLASNKKPDEARCLVEKCYSKGTDTPTDTAVVGNCSSKDPSDKKLICAMASTISQVLKSKTFDDQYTWLIPEKDPTNGGQVCLDPNSDAFKKKAGKLTKVIATKDGVKVVSQTYPSTEWKDEPSFCPAAGGSAAKTITMHIFTASWCGPCQTLKASLNTEKKRLQKDGITLTIVEHDIDTPSGKKFAKDKGIDISRIPVSAVPGEKGGLSRVSNPLTAIREAERRFKK